MHTRASKIFRHLLIATATLASGAVGLSSAVMAQNTTPLTTTTNQNSMVNPGATWTHPYWGVETLCSDPACNPVIPILNPNQHSPLASIYDYYAYSPPLTKFVDPLPTVPIAAPDQNKYLGSDYYELSVEDYKFSFHRDMGPAVLRGYQQTNDTSGYSYAYTGSDGVPHSWPLTQLHQNMAGYVGPQIINMRNVPTRVKMTNNKSITGSGPHNYPDGSLGPSGLQIPVDETMPGAGSGPPVHLSAGSYAQHTTAANVAASYAYYTATGTTTSYLSAAVALTNVRTTTNNLAVDYLPAVPSVAALTNIYNSATPDTISWVTAANTASFALHATTQAAGYTWLTSDLVVAHAVATTGTIPTGAGVVSAPAGFRNFPAGTGTHAGLRYFYMNNAGNDCSTATGGSSGGNCSQYYYGTSTAATVCNSGTQAKGVCAVIVTYAATTTQTVNGVSVTLYNACSTVSAADRTANTAAYTSACTGSTLTGWAANTACTAATSSDCHTYTVAQLTTALGLTTAGNGNGRVTVCNATAQTITGLCTTFTLTQYQSCATTPAIPAVLAPACTTTAQATTLRATFTQYMTCTSAMQAVPTTFACVPVAASAQYASCAASGTYPGGSIPGQITCGNVTLPQYTQCAGSISPTANPAIVCTTTSYTQYASCAGTSGNPYLSPYCTTVSWTGATACLDASNNPAPAGLISQAGFACKGTTWAMGDYCNVTQADVAGYQCTAGDYSFDRSLLHQHGGNTPWISDGTPHQWTTPVGDTTSPYKRGLSNFNVPDMGCAFDTANNTETCAGVNTYFYTNQNSARMMWYHDHSFGLTRINVYNGELSLYLLTDKIEQAMLGKSTAGNAWDNLLASVGLATDTQTPTTAGAISTYQPDNRFGDTLGTTLAIQDKTFVWGNDNNPNFGSGSAAANGASITNPITTQYKDSLWYSACGKIPAPTSATTGYGVPGAGGPMGSKNPCPTDTGSLWFPHVYSSNTDPNTGATVSGGRWDFGPWVYPAATIYNQYLPTVSAVPESFLDTIVTNGKAYPYMNVPRKPMRFRIINASNERYLNLQLYYAVNNSGVANKTSATPFNVDPTTVCNTGGNTDAAAPLGTLGLTTHNYANCTEVGMILQNGSQKTGAYLVPIPAYIKPPAPCTATNLVDCAANADGTPYDPSKGGQVYVPVNTGTWQHFGGVPDPTTQVPFIQIGNEGGFLPFPIVHYNQTTEIETDPRNITLSNVRNNPVANPPTCAGCVLPYPGYTLALGPAERADIIIDFGSVPDGATLILYNDMIAPNPGYDQRYDLFTGDADMTAINGPGQTQPGRGPNTRTIMQFRVDGTISFPGAVATTTSGRTTYSKPLPANWVEEVDPYGSVYNGSDARPIPSASTATLNVALAAAFAASHADPIVSASATTTTSPRTTPDGQRAYSDGTPYYMGAIDPPAYMDLTAAGGAAKTCDGSDPNLAGCATSRLCTYGDVGLCTGGIVEFPTCKNATTNALNGKINNSVDPNYRKTCGFPVFTKAIAEDFDPPFGRLNAMLGNETTSLEANGQQTYGFPFVEPITERLHEGETQIWQVIHNGVDTHTVHFHLMNVQVINRIDWAGIPKLPDAEERGWKELVKFQPLETTVIAVRMNRPGQNYDNPANNPPILFAVPTSYRVSDVTSAVGETDPAANAQGQQLLVPFLDFGNGLTTYANAVEDFSWEYVWHCHLLGHEEADMMRPQVMQLDNNGVAGQPAVPAPAGLRLGIQ